MRTATLIILSLFFVFAGYLNLNDPDPGWFVVTFIIRLINLLTSGFLILS